MRGSGFSATPLLLFLLLLAVLGLTLKVMLERNSGSGEPGQIWRNGWLSGEQIRLFDDGRYIVQEWCRVCAERAIERGRWAKVGTTVSLVPQGASRPRLLSHEVQDGERYLFDPAPPGADKSPAAGRYQRVE